MPGQGRSLGLMNCTLCGRLTHQNPVGICASCSDQLEEEFRVLRDTLAEHGRRSAPELEAMTGVPLSHIQWLIRTGWLTGVADAGDCPICGLAGQGGLCPDCAERLLARRGGAKQLFYSHAPPFRKRSDVR